MKKFLLTVLVFMIGFPMIGQEVRFPAAIVSAGGGSSGSTANLSRWRLAPVHVITLNIDENVKSDLKSISLPVTDWKVSICPNPVDDFLYLEFEFPEQREFILKITDMSGRVMFIQEARTFLNGTTVEHNVSCYSPGLYLLHIASPDLSSQKVYSIIKL